jgi:hypothetical protein
MTAREAIIFPRDTENLLRMAHGGATDDILAIFPDHLKTNEGIHLAAYANYTMFKRCFFTDDPLQMELLFLEAYMCAYDCMGQFLEKHPEAHQQLTVLSEDERLGAIHGLFDAAWRPVLGKRCLQRVTRTLKKKRGKK